jgi:YVTN family beta-propeller protein
MDAGLSTGISSLGLLTLWRLPMSLVRVAITPLLTLVGGIPQLFSSARAERCCVRRPRLLRAGRHAHWLVSTVLMAGLFFSFPVGVVAQSVLVAGGQISSSAFTNTAEVYNPATAAWSPTANSIPNAPPNSVGGLCAPSMALLGNGQVLLAGGGCTDAGYTTNAASLYNPVTNQWTAAPNFMNYGRDQFGMLTLNGGNALAFAGCAGGCDGPNILGQYFATVGPSAEIYGVATGQWTIVADLTTARGNIGQGNQYQSDVELQGGSVLVCNGSNGVQTSYNTCEIYDPIANTWTPTGSLPSGETGIHHLVLLPTGNVLTVLNDGMSAMLFNPSSGTWTSTGSLTGIEVGGNLVSLANGQVLDCGGTDASGNPVSTAQVYDASSAQWSAVGPMMTSRWAHIAVRLASGQVLAAGGFTTGDAILSAAEIFDPSSGTWSSTMPMTQARAYANALLLGQTGPFAYVASMSSNSVSMIDIPSSTLVNTINVGSGPWGVAISPDQNQVYVTNNQGNSVSIIDTQSSTVVGTVLGLSSPLGVAFTPPNGSQASQAYVVNGSSNSISVIDTASQTIVANVPVQSSPVGVAMAYTSIGTFAYVANSGSNSVSVITGGSSPTVTNVSVGTTPVWAAVTPNSAYVYVEDAGSNDIKVISVAANNTVVATISLAVSPNSAAFTPDGTFAYVTSTASNSVVVIDTTTSPPTVVTTVPNVNGASQVALTADGTAAFVTNQNSSAVSVIDTANNTISGTVTVGTTPIGIAIASAPLAELQITQPLSPTQPNTFTFPTANYVVQYPPGTQISGVNMTVAEKEITQAEFQQRVVGTNYAGAACIVYGGTGGNCVDHIVTCSDNDGNPITCPTASAIGVQTSFNTSQSIVNPGYLTTPIGENQWNNIFSGFYGTGNLITVKGKTTGFSEFVAVDLGAGNPQGQAKFQIVSPQFPATYSQGQAIPISFQLTSVVPPNPPVTDAQASISVVMTANGNGNPMQQEVFSENKAFKQQGSSGIYKYTLNATAYAAGTYSVTIYGNAFPTFQGQFAIQAAAGSVVLVPNPTSLTFSNQGVGTSSATMSDSLLNEGTVQGLVSSVETTGDFQIKTNDCAKVKPGAQCKVAIVFSPTDIGTRTGTLSYYDNASNSPQSVALWGTGISATTTTLASSLNPSFYGQAVTLTAAVVPVVSETPTGNVTFYDGATSLGTVALTNGSAALTTSALTGGNHSLTAAYAGSGYFDSSTSSVLVQTVARAAPDATLTSSMNPSQVNQAVTFSAVVSGSQATPSGTVKFVQGSKDLGTVTLVNGQASLTTTFTTAGSFSIYVEYSGDQNYLKRNSKILKQTVQQ